LALLHQLVQAFVVVLGMLEDLLQVVDTPTRLKSAFPIE
jgi:hypothetical protein